MMIRIATFGIPKFNHGTVSAGPGWSACEFSKNDADGIKTLRSYVGRFLRVHPDDAENLKALGLTIKAGSVVDYNAAPAPAAAGIKREVLDAEQPAENAVAETPAEATLRIRKARR